LTFSGGVVSLKFRVETIGAKGKMNWFRRHLNWTMVLAWVICISLAAIFASGAEVALSWGRLSGGLILLAIGCIFVGLMWWATIWAIKQKGRSLLHLFWLLVPFGFIVLLVLKNLNEKRGNET